MTKKELKKKYEGEIMELKNDIRILVENKNFYEVECVKLKWNIRIASSDLICGKPLEGKCHQCGKPKLLGVECMNPATGKCDIDLINAQYNIGVDIVSNTTPKFTFDKHY